MSHESKRILNFEHNLKLFFHISLLLFFLIPQGEFLYAQDSNDLLQQGKDFFNQGKIKECEKSLTTYFNQPGQTFCQPELLEYLEIWAISTLLNRSEQALDRMEKVENCALNLDLRSQWTKYLIEHSEALRLMNMGDAARPKLLLALSSSNLSATDKAQSYAILASCYVNEKGDSTILYANRALEIAYDIPDTIAILESFQALSVHARSIGKFHEAIQWNRRALNYQKGIYVRKKPETFANIARLFSQLKDYEKAEKYIDSTFQTVDTTVYVQFSAVAGMLQGEIFKNTKRPEAAKNKFLVALKKTNKDHLKFNCLLELSAIEKELGNNSLSNQYLEQALKLGAKIDDPEVQKSIALIRSKNSFAEKKYSSAKSWAEKGLAIQQKNTSQSYTPDFYWQLAIAAEKLNQHDQSLEYYKKYYTGEDSMTALINQELVYTLENEYTAAEQDKSLFNLNTQNTLQQLRLKQQRWIGIGILLFLTFLAFTLFFLIRLNKKIKSQTLIIQDAVQEKNILLKEIHHRVKNNLQVISSLFNLQSRFVKDGNALNALKESHNRVNSLALLHQNLYQEENLKGIEMPSYIDQLCDALFSATSNTNYHVNYENKIAPLILDIDTVIPLGLIITELVSSALKRNFADDGAAVIKVALEEKENSLKLSVKDNSLASSENYVLDKKSFSQKIIDAFSKKLKASIELKDEEGIEINMVIERYRLAG